MTAPTTLTLPDDVAALFAGEAARSNQGDVVAYLTRVVLDERVRREGSRRSLLLSRADGVARLHHPVSWQCHEGVDGQLRAAAGWLVRSGRPVQVVAGREPLFVVQSVHAFRAGRQWFDLARHYLTNP